MGGVEKSLLNYIENLQPEYRIKIFSLKKLSDNIFKNKNAEVIFGGNPHLFIYVTFLIYCIRNRRDIFHVLNTGPMIIFLCRLARIRRFIYHIRGTRYFKKRKFNWLFRILWKIAIPRHTVFLANSDYSNRRFKEQITSRFTVRTLYNPFDFKKFNALNRRKNEHFTILYAGRMVKGKNLFKWLDIARFLKNELPTLKFLMVGRGALKPEIEKYIVDKKMEEYVRVQDYIEDIDHVYRSCSLLLFISEYESFGNVVVESVLCGTPVLAGNIPSMKEIFKGNESFLVDLESKNLDKDILDRIRNYKRLESDTENLKHEFMKRFSLDKHLDAIKLIYEQFN